MEIEKIKKIKLILKEFKPFDPKSKDYSEFINISTGNYTPPSYIVQILLLGILGLKNYGSMDKVSWHTFVQYKAFPFMIRDYKFSSWTIEGRRKDKETIQLVKKIQNKIIKASKIVVKILYTKLKSEVEKGRFYLNNVYHKLFSIYKFYEQRVSDAIKEYKEIKKSKNFSYIIEKLNTELSLQRTISKYSFALILSFFSLLEFSVDVIYIFEKPNAEFFKFRKKKLNDRFKLVFPINKNKKLKSLYDFLINIKTNYRNLLAHGLINEVNLLVPLPFAGLVPLSYEYLSKKIFYGPTEIEKDDALKIVCTFRKFLKFIENEDPYKFYMLYLNYGFPIPVNAKKISGIKKEMTSYEEFKEFLENKAIYEDMVINRDI